MLWGHRNDPENFHRCLRTSTGGCPDILEALRDGDLLVITSDHGCDPTTPSTDHSREHALLLLAYAEGQERGRADPRGRRVRRRRRDRERLARRQAERQAARHADRHAVRLDDPEAVRRGIRDRGRARAARRTKCRRARRVRGVAEVAALLEVGCGWARLRPRELGRSSRSTISPRMVELARARGRRRSATCRRCRSRTASTSSRWMLYHVPTSIRSASCTRAAARRPPGCSHEWALASERALGPRRTRSLDRACSLLHRDREPLLPTLRERRATEFEAQ